MLQNERSRNRNEWVKGEYDKAEQAYREHVAMIHRVQDFLDYVHSFKRVQFLVNRFSGDNAYRRKMYCLKINANPAWPDVDMYVYNMPIEKAINDICGPIHKQYGVDWKMDPKPSGDVWLRTEIRPRYSSLPHLQVNVIVNNGIPKCNIVTKDVVRSWTRTETQIKCS